MTASYQATLFPPGETSPKYQCVSFTSSPDLSHLDLENGLYNYRMILLPNQMKFVPVVRCEWDETDITGGDSGTFQIYVHPFENLKISSHIHPRFVIYGMGRKLEHRLTPDELASFTEAHPDLVHRIRTIYTAWCQAIPDDAEEDSLFRPPTPEPANTEERERNSCYETTQRRIAPYTLRAPELTDICPDRGPCHVSVVSEEYCRFQSESEDTTESDSQQNTNWATEPDSDIRPESLPSGVEDIDVDVDDGMERWDSSQNTPPMRADAARRLRRRRMKMKDMLERRKHGPTIDSAGQVRLTAGAMREHEQSQEDSSMWDSSSIAGWCTNTREALSLGLNDYYERYEVYVIFTCIYLLLSMLSTRRWA
jgi:hypothetical protein